MGWRRGSAVGWLMLAVVGCSGDTISSSAAGGTGGDDSTCSGEETCACYDNGTCDAGLTCASRLCVRIATNQGGKGAADGGISDGGISDGGASDGGASDGGRSTGGTSATGGVSATGGATVNGGTGATGGRTVTGGTAVNGGAAPTGGRAATGGASAAGGGSAAGGSGADGAVACPPIEDAVLLDFTDTDSSSSALFGTSGETFAGGTLAYPTTLESDVTEGNWHLTGTVDDYSGFGVYFENDCAPVDASAYQGIRFMISGSMPEDRDLVMWVNISANTISSSWLVSSGTDAAPNSGRCIPASNNQYDGTCSMPRAAVLVSESAEAVELRWADFTGGAPEDSVEPSEITGFGWYFAWGGAADTPYDVDLVLDDVGFLE